MTSATYAGAGVLAEPAPPRVSLVVGLVGAVVVVVRLVLAGPAFDRMWAEDGAVFLTDAHNSGARSLGWTYSGYLHTVPRLLGLLADQLPLSWAAVVFVTVTAALTGAVVALIHRRALAIMPAAPAALAALVVVLSPVTGYQTLGSIASWQFIALTGLGWALAVGPRGRRQRWCGAGFALAVSLSTPLGVLLLPAALLGLRRAVLRDPAVWAVAAGTAVQLLAGRFAPVSPFVNPNVRPPGLYADRLVSGLARRLELPGWTVAVVVTLLVLAAVWATVRVSRRLPDASSRPFVVLVAGAASTGVGTLLIAGQWQLRYLVAPTSLGAGVLVLLLAAAPTGRLVWGAVAVAVLVASVPGAPASGDRTEGAAFRTRAAEHDRECAAGRTESTRFSWSPPAWGETHLSCADGT